MRVRIWSPETVATAATSACWSRERTSSRLCPTFPPYSSSSTINYTPFRLRRLASGELLLQPLIGSSHPFGDDLGPGGDGHVVGIPQPAGDNMGVEVLGHPCPRHLFQVKPDIEPLGPHAFLEEGDHAADQLKVFQQLLLGQVLQLRGVAVGG